MDAQTSGLGFSWDFLDEMAKWTLRLAALIALGGLLVLRDPTFALGCLLGAMVDVGLVRLAAHKAKVALERGEIDTTSGAILLGGRAIAKGLLLLLAVLLPSALDFAGTVVGVLAYDVTLAVVGSIVAVRRGMHVPREGE